ncbi:MAG: DUF2793 domain-containing protein [Mangrovicoccus sp.]
MSNTANLELPLLQPSQAQKHVTVNEALGVLDSVAQLTLVSMTTATPPGGALDGEGYLVPLGATGDWVGAEGLIAIFSNNGWRIVKPQPGWRTYVRDQGAVYIFDGIDWHCDAVAATANGAATQMSITEIDHTITAGANNSTAALIPPYSVVFGVTARVISDITGANGWSLGVAGHSDRYGNGLQTIAGSWGYGLTGQALSYFAQTPLVITAEGGSFTGGIVRLAIHGLTLSLPRQ